MTGKLKKRPPAPSKIKRPRCPLCGRGVRRLLNEDFVIWGYRGIAQYLGEINYPVPSKRSVTGWIKRGLPIMRSYGRGKNSEFYTSGRFLVDWLMKHHRVPAHIARQKIQEEKERMVHRQPDHTRPVRERGIR